MRIFLMVLLVAGCGGELGGSAPSPIVGAWQAQQTCSTTFAFRADGTYAQATACAEGVQLEVGTFAAIDGTLTLITLDSTCPAWAKTSAMTYDLTPGRLQLSDASAILVLTPATEAPSVATPGCFFDASGVSAPFQPSPLAPL